MVACLSEVVIEEPLIKVVAVITTVFPIAIEFHIIKSCHPMPRDVIMVAANWGQRLGEEGSRVCVCRWWDAGHGLGGLGLGLGLSMILDQDLPHLSCCLHEQNRDKYSKAHIQGFLLNTASKQVVLQVCCASYK